MMRERGEVDLERLYKNSIADDIAWWKNKDEKK